MLRTAPPFMAMLLFALFGFVASVSGADVARSSMEQETYHGAAESAKKAVQKIWDLQSAVETKARQSLDDKQKEAEQRAESDLGLSEEQLSKQFISLQKDAASQVAKSHLDAAKKSLQSMEERGDMSETLESTLDSDMNGIKIFFSQAQAIDLAKVTASPFNPGTM
eukprot:Skav222306  [mRNA]  locus=scaffold1249:58287:64657:- [translate_table: standard]